MPCPSDQILSSIAEAIRGLRVLHHDSLPTVEPVLVRTPCDPEDPEFRVAASAVALALLTFLLAAAAPGAHSWFALLLIVAAAALQVLQPARRLARVSRKLAARLTVRWSDAIGHGAW